MQTLLQVYVQNALLLGACTSTARLGTNSAARSSLLFQQRIHEAWSENILRETDHLNLSYRCSKRWCNRCSSCYCFVQLSGRAFQGVQIDSEIHFDCCDELKYTEKRIETNVILISQNVIKKKHKCTGQAKEMKASETTARRMPWDGDSWPWNSIEMCMARLPTASPPAVNGIRPKCMWAIRRMHLYNR